MASDGNSWRQGHLKEIFSKLQDFIIFLIHVTSGPTGRADDLAELSFEHTADGTKCITAALEYQLEIVTSIHKHERRPTAFLNVVRRHPVYSVCCALSLFGSFRILLFQLHDDNIIWSQEHMSSIDVIKGLDNASSICFPHFVNLSDWRYALQISICEYSQEIW